MHAAPEAKAEDGVLNNTQNNALELAAHLLPVVPYHAIQHDSNDCPNDCVDDFCLFHCLISFDLFSVFMDEQLSSLLRRRDLNPRPSGNEPDELPLLYSAMKEGGYHYFNTTRARSLILLAAALLSYPWLKISTPLGAPPSYETGGSVTFVCNGVSFQKPRARWAC